MNNQTDEEMERTRENAQHVLQCHKGIGRSYWEYFQPCHIIKEMSDGERYKVLTFGYQNSRSFGDECRIRYVSKHRVFPRKEQQ